MKHGHRSGRLTRERAGADANQTQPPNRGRKLIVDIERQKCEVSDLTVDEERAMAAEVMARVAALRRRWEASGDLRALLGALVFYQTQLPEWLFKGLMHNFERSRR